MASGGVVDALPYVDQEYDIPVLRETVRVAMQLYELLLFFLIGSEAD